MTLVKFADNDAIEPCPIDDTFCPEVYGIQAVGPCHRLVLATRDTNLIGGDEQTFVVVAKLVLTDESLTALAEAIPKYLEQRECRDEPPEPQAPRPTCNGTPKLTIVEPAQDSAG